MSFRYGRDGLTWAAALLAATALTTLAAPPARAASPIASWSFDESGGQTVRDRQQRADGVLGRGSGVDSGDPQRVAGVTGGALLFDGDDRVTLPDLNELEPAALSISAWVRRSGTPGAYRYIVSKGGTRCEASAYGLYSESNGGLAFYVADGMTFAISPAAPAPDVWDGRWHSVAGTFDGASVRLYVDGHEVGNGTASALSISYTRDSRAPFLGTYVGSCELAWSGEMDQVAIWRGALSPGDAAALATPPLPDPLDPQGPPAGPGPGTDPMPGAGPGPVAGAQPPPTLAKRCVTVTLSRRAAVIRRAVRVGIRVRLGARPLSRALVRLRGAGVARTARTAHDGRARVRIRPTSRAVVTVDVAGRTECDAARIAVRRH